jgi:hypothetical protein
MDELEKKAYEEKMQKMKKIHPELHNRFKLILDKLTDKEKRRIASNYESISTSNI